MSDISVIIPVKNRAELLRQTLDNLLSQSKKPDEIIVVDDHSTDDIKLVIFDYITDCIFLNNKGTGPGAARNLGLSIATGKYIQFFDSDDLVTKDKLKNQFEALEKTGADMAYGPYAPARLNDRVWQQTDVVMQWKPLSADYSLTEWMLRGWNAITQSCLFSKTIVDKAGPWNDKLITHEDYLYLYKLSLQSPALVHVPGEAVIYRQHGFQSTDHHTRNQSRARDKMDVLVEINSGLANVKADIWSKIYFKGRLFQNFRFLKKAGFDPRYYSGFIGPADFVSEMAYRLYNKQMRNATGTNWEPMHGVEPSEKVFKDILDRLKSE